MQRRPLIHDDSRLVQSREITRRLNISTISLILWRKGSRRRRPIRCEYSRAGQSKRVYYRESELLSYLGSYRPDLFAKWINEKWL